MTESRILINSSLDENNDDDQQERDVTTDEERLLRTPAYKPRNNFPSYSNDDVSVRFRRVSHAHTTFSNLIASVSNRQSNRLATQDITPGATNFLSTRYESLDYDPCENHLVQDEERLKGYKFIVRKNFARWLIFLLIGIFTALIACFVDVSVEVLSDLKYSKLAKLVDHCVDQNCLWLAYAAWLGLNVGPALVGAFLVTYVEPVASGSGIPQVKCYLNGIKMPRVVRIKTLFVKIVGVISTVVGGLAGGKEGPMIHAGAVVSAGISQGKSTTFNNWDLGIFRYFREDHEKRDFVSGGAAAGVSAAFGAPIGGVLFSIEEGTSFFNQSLTWRTFFASMISTFTLNIVLSAYHGHPGDLSYPGLLNLGKFETIPYQVYEIPLFMLVGTMGGLFGSLWNHMNYKIMCFRMRYVRAKWLKILEVVAIAALAATMGSMMIYFSDDCQPIDVNRTKFPTRMYCDEDEYSAAAALWFQTPESTVRSLFHSPKGSHNDVTLAVFVVLYFILAAFTFGLSMSSGLFIPSLLIGSAWGRLFGSAIAKIIPSCPFFEPGKYALLGAAAQLGGVVRMTISLTAILIEATQGISFGLPVIIVLMMAKWVGDFFNEGIYDIHTQMAGVPLLPWEAPPLSNNIYASEIMSHPIVTLKTTENVGHIVELLKCVSFNGFPVVDPPTADGDEIKSYGRLRGLILRSQLIVLIKNRVFKESDEGRDMDYNIKMFRNEYPRYPTIDEIKITDIEKTYTVELCPFMNSSPYTLQHSATLPRAFRLFRALGLRHLPVVNDLNEVIGMITRKDVARYRIWKHCGRMGLDELLTTNKRLAHTAARMNENARWTRSREHSQRRCEYHEAASTSGDVTSTPVESRRRRRRSSTRPNETEEEAIVRRFHDAQRMARFRAKKRKAVEEAKALEASKLSEIALISELRRRNVAFQITSAPAQQRQNTQKIQETPRRETSLATISLVNGSGRSKYSQLLSVIEELGRDIKLSYAGSKSSAEKLKTGIVQARTLVRDCLLETELNARQ